MRKLVRLAALAVALFAPAAPALAKPPVWVIRDADSTIVLFGSVHVLPKGLDWRPQALDQALANADDVWFEIPFDAASQLASAQMVTARGFLPQGQSLNAMLSKRDRALMASAAKTLDLTPEALDRLQPWMADLALSEAFAARQGAASQTGVELTLSRDAPASAVRRHFETVDQQIGMLADAPRKEQLQSLSETLREIDKDPGSFEATVRDWLNGDVAGIVKEALDPLRRHAPAVYDRLIRKRNADWAGQIEQRLAGSGETVMVVGAGHLVGPDSVPALLRARGIKVEGP